MADWQEDFSDGTREVVETKKSQIRQNANSANLPPAQKAALSIFQLLSSRVLILFAIHSFQFTLKKTPNGPLTINTFVSGSPFSSYVSAGQVFFLLACHKTGLINY